jgi:hypothetical protein
LPEKLGRMMPDSTLRGAIAAILEREGATKSAARKIEELMKREQRFADLKNAPDQLGISSRQMFRWIKSGKLSVLRVAGLTMVDVSKMSVRAG